MSRTQLLGLEWDRSSATVHERAELSGWVASYQRLRGLLHTATTVRNDSPDPVCWLHGVVGLQVPFLDPEHALVVELTG